MDPWFVRTISMLFSKESKIWGPMSPESLSRTQDTWPALPLRFSGERNEGIRERIRGYYHFWAKHTEGSMPRGVGWGPQEPLPASVRTSKRECPGREAQKYLGASSSYSQAQPGKADLRGNAVTCKDRRSSSLDSWRSIFPTIPWG